jgi:molybdopterin-containing oxidoreductase family iron-sulfur binding subunit
VPSLKLTRRDFLKLSAAATALATAGCSRPDEPLVPYAVQPENTLPGVPRFYASAATFAGAAEGVIVESSDGRPTKIEGNPHHPASLGATTVQGQAAVLQLWDPERSQAPRRAGAPATFDAFAGELNEILASIEKQRGRGLHILSRTLVSPTLQAQLARLSARLPEARAHRWDPLNRDNVHEGARLAFGRALEPVYRIDEARAILSLDCRFMEDEPGRLAYIRAFARSREPQAGKMSRLYVVESSPSLAGAMADHRYAMPVGDIERWLVAFQQKEPAIWKDLKANRGVILAGQSLSPWAHALVHRLNRELQAPVSLVPPIDDFGTSHAESIRQLAEAMRAGAARLVVMLEGNPVYDAPGDLGFADALARVPFSVHLSLYDDETSARSTWHLPATHFLEQWGDARAFDGTASIVQPLVAPLYGGLSAHELLATLARDPMRKAYDLVRAQWKAIDWEGALKTGIVAGSPFKEVQGALKIVEAKPKTPPAWSIRFIADQSVLDGSFSNNAWLQELPRTESKITWDNAAMLSPASATELGVNNGDVIEVSAGERSIRAPAWIVPTHADRTITLPLGYGRTRAGAVGNQVGFDANVLRSSNDLWTAETKIARTGKVHTFATTQNHSRMEGRDQVKHIELEKLVGRAKAFPEEQPTDSLYAAWPYDSYRWGMTINLNTCVGCNACTIACQAENNIPTVGKEEVIAGREMHWIRVDRYYEDRKTLFMPVPCMHCENAPCEYVCPVGAPVHDSEGLNLQVYNRCVGTRFCSQNCPYKVRRFNFLHYAESSIEKQSNPEVTVRMRGVMEKCTYCLQRITRGRIEAEKAGRRIEDGEVRSACQQACPAGAIVFGDMNDEKSAVHALKRSPLKYDLLAELNTRPSTSYLGRVRNPNPDLPS